MDQPRSESLHFHLVAWALLRHDGRVLLARRSGVQYGSGLWGPPGGHVLPGETLAQTAARETLEEVGVTVDPLRLRPMGVTRYADGGVQGADFFFVTGRYAGEPRPLSECDAVGWFGLSELPDNVLPWLPRAFERHLADGVWFDELVDGVPDGPVGLE